MPDSPDAHIDGSTVPWSSSNDFDLTVDGRSRRVRGSWLGETLLYVLRERLGLPGSKNACEQGECGSCSVLLDDVVVCSCLILAADAQGCTIRTVEGLSASGDAADVQDAMVRCGAVQCGFCTPGLVVAIYDLLRHSPDATDMEIRESLSGNLCRCTGYGRIFEAVREVQRGRSCARL